MLCRSLSVCLGAAALLAALGLPGRAAAKPPDLPENETITVKPQVAPPTEEPAEPPAPPSGGAILPPPEPAEVDWTIFGALPPSLPAPAMYRLRPTVRQTLVNSLLMGCHPMLGLVPTQKILDAPCDHPQRVAGDDVFSAVPSYDSGDCVAGGIGWGVHFGGSSAWWNWLVSQWATRHAAPPPEQNEGYINAFQPATFIAGLTPADATSSDTDKSDEPAAEPIPTMPKEDSADGITCPYLRQQAADRHACPMADPQVRRDVLANLDKLMEADRMMELAEEFRREGCVCEALECYAVVQDLCPGSPCAERAVDAMTELFVTLYGLAPGAEEPAEEQPDACPQPCGQAKSSCGWLAQIGRKITAPCRKVIGTYYSNPNRRVIELLNNSEDLRQIEYEWQRIWFTEPHPHLTPEFVDRTITGVILNPECKERSESALEVGVEAQVNGLMKACRLLMNAGLHEQAAELARQAYALDPQRVMADPLIYKMHLLAGQPATPHIGSSAQCESSGTCPYCPTFGKPIPGVVSEKAKEEKASAPAGSDEASEETTPPSLEDFLNAMRESKRLLLGVGTDAEGGLRLKARWSCAGSVYHLKFDRHSLAIWKTPDDSTAPTAVDECPR